MRQLIFVFLFSFQDDVSKYVLESMPYNTTPTPTTTTYSMFCDKYIISSSLLEMYMLYGHMLSTYKSSLLLLTCSWKGIGLDRSPTMYIIWYNMLNTTNPRKLLSLVFKN